MEYFKLSKAEDIIKIEKLNGYDGNLLEHHLEDGQPETGTMDANGTMINSTEFKGCFETDGYIIGTKDQLRKISTKRLVGIVRQQQRSSSSAASAAPSSSSAPKGEPESSLKFFVGIRSRQSKAIRPLPPPEQIDLQRGLPVADALYEDIKISKISPTLSGTFFTDIRRVSADSELIEAEDQIIQSIRDLFFLYLRSGSFVPGTSLQNNFVNFTDIVKQYETLFNALLLVRIKANSSLLQNQSKGPKILLLTEADRDGIKKAVFQSVYSEMTAYVQFDLLYPWAEMKLFDYLRKQTSGSQESDLKAAREILEEMNHYFYGEGKELKERDVEKLLRMAQGGEEFLDVPAMPPPESILPSRSLPDPSLLPDTSDVDDITESLERTKISERTGPSKSSKRRANKKNKEAAKKEGCYVCGMEIPDKKLFACSKHKLVVFHDICLLSTYVEFRKKVRQPTTLYAFKCLICNPDQEYPDPSQQGCFQGKKELIDFLEGWYQEHLSNPEADAKAATVEFFSGGRKSRKSTRCKRKSTKCKRKSKKSKRKRF
jgi:hypothetical protein